MKSFGLVFAGLPLLLAPTATLAADLGVSASGPGYTLTASGGFVAFGLPAQDTAVVDSGAGSFASTAAAINALGFKGSLGGSFDLGVMDGAKLSIGGNVFGAIASGSSSAVDTFTGPGTVVISGYSTPAGSIALITGANPQSAISGTGAAAADQTITTSGPSTDVIGAVQHAAGSAFSLAIASTNPSGAAHGAIATSAGGIFVGTGSLNDLTVATRDTQSLVYTGANISLSASGELADGAELQASVGPAFRRLGQHTTIITTVNIPSQTGLVMPSYADNRTEDLTSDYFGALGGLGVSKKVNDTTTFSIGGEVGIYNRSSSFTGSESYALGGGSGTSGLPLAAQSVAGSAAPSGSANGMAYSASISGALTLAMTKSLSLSLGGSAEYLSSVPVLSHGVTSLVAGAGGADASYAGAAGSAGALPKMGFTSMVNFGATISLGGHF